MSPTIAPIEDRRSLGIGLVVLAQVFFAVLDTSAKWLSVAGIPVFEVVFVRYLVPVAVLLAVLLPGQGLAVFRTRNLKLEVLRGLCLAGVTAAMFYALKFLPLTVTGSLLFTMPLIVCALSVPLLGESVGWRRWAAIAVGFGGILVIVRPGTEAFHPAALLCLLSALLAALYSITTRKLAGVDSPRPSRSMSGFDVSDLCHTLCVQRLGLAHQPGRPGSPSSRRSAGLIAHQLITVAHRFAPPSTLAPFTYIELLLLALASWLIFSEPPDVWFYVGAPMIIGSGLLHLVPRAPAPRTATVLTPAED